MTLQSTLVKRRLFQNALSLVKGLIFMCFPLKKTHVLFLKRPASKSAILFSDGKKLSMTILLPGLLFGMILSIQKSSSMYSWQLAVR